MLPFFSSKSESQFGKLEKPKSFSGVHSARYLGIVKDRWTYSKSCILFCSTCGRLNPEFNYLGFLPH